MKSDTDNKQKQIDEILTRGVGEFIDPDGAFRQKLIKKVKGEHPGEIIIKFGVDPTRPDIHLGHAVVLRKLRALQDLDCKVVFLVGDFTALIGDPTGKSKVRPEVEQADIKRNMKTYLDQVGKILKTDPVSFSWITNSDWFLGVTDIVSPQNLPARLRIAGVSPNSFVGKAHLYENTRMQKTDLHKKQNIQGFTLLNLISVMRLITHSRLVDRDMFQERIKSGKELYMHEMIYPVLQGVDSYILQQIYGTCDLEIGGTDQTFNMLMGRDMMKTAHKDAQSVLALKLLEGTDGQEKMSKSLDNYVGITDEPSAMYGKIMSMPDTSIKNYFELCTYTPLSGIEKIIKEMNVGKSNPRDVKMKLAHEIVAIYHGEDSAKKAEDDFMNTFSKKNTPEDMREVAVKKGEILADVLLNENIIGSKTEFRRLVKEGAIKTKDSEKWKPIAQTEKAQINEPMILKIGKRRFLKINLI